jgi:MFS family permease
LTWHPRPDPSRVWLPREQAVVPRLLAIGAASAAAAEGAAVAVALAVYTMTDSTAWVSGALLATLGFSALISPIAGVMADRHDRRRLMLAVAIAEVPVFVLAAVAGHAWQIIGLVAVGAAVQRVFDAALGASIPALVPDEGLPRATSSFAAAQQTAMLLSPAALGAIIAAGGHRWAFGAVAVLYAVTIVAVAGLPAAARPAGAHHGLAGELRDGLAALLGDRVVVWTTVALTVLLVFSAFTLVAGVALAEQEFDAGGTAYGFMVSCWGGGMIIGSLAAGRLAERRSALAVFAGGMGIAGFALGLVSIAPTLAVALGMLAVGGAGNGLMSASGQLLFQRRVPNAVLGRVLGAASALWRVAYAASFLLGGIVIAVAGVRGVFALAGAGTLVALLPLLLLLVSHREPEPAGSPAPGD